MMQHHDESGKAHRQRYARGWVRGGLTTEGV